MQMQNAKLTASFHPCQRAALNSTCRGRGHDPSTRNMDYTCPSPPSTFNSTPVT